MHVDLPSKVPPPTKKEKKALNLWGQISGMFALDIRIS